VLEAEPVFTLPPAALPPRACQHWWPQGGRGIYLSGRATCPLNLVGMPGFEPGASCSQSRRANQAAPHPADTPKPIPCRPLCLNPSPGVHGRPPMKPVRYSLAVQLPRGRSSMAEPQPSKLVMRVRFPSPAPTRRSRSTRSPAAELSRSRSPTTSLCPLRARSTRIVSRPACVSEHLTHRRGDRLVPFPCRMLIDQRRP
jgi:hypothetical protein